MCRVRSRDLPPAATSAGDARLWVAAQLARWELTERIDDVALLTSELVTNAVVHARSGLRVTVAVAEGVLEIGVGDRDPRSPRIPPPSADAPPTTAGPDAEFGWLTTGGRGLRLVDALADEWGTAALTEGKQVWFRLPVAKGWQHRSACPCRGQDLALTRLDSGRQVAPVPGPWDE